MSWDDVSGKGVEAKLPALPFSAAQFKTKALFRLRAHLFAAQQANNVTAKASAKTMRGAAR